MLLKRISWRSFRICCDDKLRKKSYYFSFLSIAIYLNRSISKSYFSRGCPNAILLASATILAYEHTAYKVVISQIRCRRVLGRVGQHPSMHESRPRLQCGHHYEFLLLRIVV